MSAMAIPVPAGRPGVLVRCGLLTPEGKVAGAETHPDAELMDMIERYTALTERSRLLWERACKYNQSGKRHKQLCDEAFSQQGEIERLEIRIDQTPAKTVIGAISKVSLAMGEIDPMGEGVSKRGTQFRLALTALIDAKAMLEAAQ